MKRLLLFLFVFLPIFPSLAQERILFSKAVEENIREYSKKSNAAYYYQNIERAKFLFDSIIDNVVKGSYMDNFEINRKSGIKTEIHQFKKPLILISYCTWCTPGKGEIPALNKIAKKYHKDIDFVVLFWDSKRNVRRASRKYSKRIHILYVDERDNRSDHIVKTIKHSFGMPTTFFIDEQKKIVDLRRSVIYHYNQEFETSFKSNYDSFLNGVSILKDLNKDPEIVSEKPKLPKEI